MVLNYIYPQDINMYLNKFNHLSVNIFNGNDNLLICAKHGDNLCYWLKKY